MTDAVFYLAQWEQRQPRDILTALLLPPADVVCVQETGPTFAGLDAPLDRALTLTLGARKPSCSPPPALWLVPARHFIFVRTNLPEAMQLLHRCRLLQAGVAGLSP